MAIGLGMDVSNEEEFYRSAKEVRHLLKGYLHELHEVVNTPVMSAENRDNTDADSVDKELMFATGTYQFDENSSASSEDSCTTIDNEILHAKKDSHDDACVEIPALSEREVERSYSNLSLAARGRLKKLNFNENAQISPEDMKKLVIREKSNKLIKKTTWEMHHYVRTVVDEVKERVKKEGVFVVLNE